MPDWSPLSDDEFAELFDSQYRELNDDERAAFNAFRVRPWKAIIRRSEVTGDEAVFVVAQLPGGFVLYFDDIEYGFNISHVDANGRITEPRGGQDTLKESVQYWPQIRTRLSDDEFTDLFNSHYHELSADEQVSLAVFRVTPFKAIIQRTDSKRDEIVFVVAQLPDGRVLYFDDVNHSFDVSPINSNGRIIAPNDTQDSLGEAIHRWFPRLL